MMPSAAFRRIVQALLIATWMSVLLQASSIGHAAKLPVSDLVVDRSSPEAHLRTFLKSAHKAAVRLEAREWARAHYGAWLYPPATDEDVAEMTLLKHYMLESLDLSGLPDWRRETGGIETALMLYEILRAEGITAQTPVRQLRDGLWVIPGTYIQIGTIATGMRAGDVVFTADTVANTPSLYDLAFEGITREGFSPYVYYTETPGGLLVPRWAGLAQKLPGVLRWQMGSNTIFQWSLTMIVICVVIGFPLAILRRVPNGKVRWFLQAVLMILLANWGSGLAVDEAGLSGAAANIVTLLFMALYYLAVTACVLIVGEWIGNWMSAVQTAKDKTFDSSIIRLATRVISTAISIAVLIYGISTAGIPVLGIIAGFGVGGLAVALAAKPSLENILAGVILFLDGSIKVGDTIDTGSISGKVEDIGMRSTRIRGTDGSLISITNSELADKVIKNLSPRLAMPPGEPGRLGE